MICLTSPRAASAAFTHIMFYTLLCCAPVFAQLPAMAVAPGPVICQIGGFVSALRAVDTSSETFDADIWFWSVCPDGLTEPLKTMEFTNALESTASLDSVTPRPQGPWAQRKIVGRFEGNFDLRNYPFDRHELVIEVEEGVQDVTGLAYATDKANSGVATDMSPEQWHITSFALRPAEKVYKTNFGDPSLTGGESTYTHLDLVIGVERADFTSFMKLAIPVYIATGLALISLLMQIESMRNVLNPRIALLAGCLFAVVFNLSTTSNAIGSVPYVTLMDMIHFFSLLVILACTLAAVASAHLIERGIRPVTLRRIDYNLFYCIATVFILGNIVLIVRAMLIG